MKLIYVSLISVLVTMNSAFAMLCDEEGPSGENSAFAMLCDKEGPSGDFNRYFFLKKETVIKHLESEEPRYPYGMVQPVKPLIIEGCEYDLWGFMRGALGENLKNDPTIQWIILRNNTIFPSAPLEHWAYIAQPNNIFDKDNGVTFELHKKPVLQSTPVCSSSYKD